MTGFKMYLAWGMLLLAQNASFTAVSRARNSGSLLYNAIASVGSNGLWWIGQAVVITLVADAIAAKDTVSVVVNGIFYTIMTVVGSVSMQHFLMKKVEKGKRKVGA